MNKAIEEMLQHLYKNEEDLSRKDGFKSTHLREQILRNLADIRLPGRKETKNYNTKFSQTQTQNKENQKINCFLEKTESIAIEIAKNEAQKEFRDTTDDTSKTFMLAGAEKIGRKIGCEYGLELYERLLTEKKTQKEIPQTNLKKEKEPARYGFIVENFGNDIKILSPVTELQKGQENNLIITDKRITEIYVFASKNIADNQHSLWEAHIDDITNDIPKGIPAPVRYGYIMETDINDRRNAGQIFAIYKDESISNPTQNMDERQNEGSVTEIITAESLAEIINKRTAMLGEKEIKTPQIESPKRTQAVKKEAISI